MFSLVYLDWMYAQFRLKDQMNLWDFGCGWMDLMQIISLKWHCEFMWMNVLIKMVLWIYMKKWINWFYNRAL